MKSSSMEGLIYKLILFLLTITGAISISAQQSNYVVLYISNSDPLIGGDSIIVAELDSMGYNVMSLTAGSFTTTSHTDFDADVIVFGESLSPNAVIPFKNADFPIPCISLEGWAVRVGIWDFIADNDLDFAQLGSEDPPIEFDFDNHYSITIKADHPITNYAGLAVDSLVKWSSQIDRAFPPQVTYFTLPMANATILADVSGELDFHTMYAIEPDTTGMDTLNPLNHRMFIWGTHENGLGNLEPIFFKILDGAILWVLNEKSTAINPLKEASARLIVQPNPFTNIATVEFDLKKAGQVSLEIFDITGRKYASQRKFMPVGKQRFTFRRSPEMPSGAYTFLLRVNGEAFGFGKMIVYNI